SSAFSRTLASSTCLAASFSDALLLKVVKYAAPVSTAAPNTSSPHCLILDNSLKFSIALRPLGLHLLAGQGECKRLHIFDGVVLEGLFDLDVPKLPALLQVGNQVGDGVGAQCHPLNVDACSLVFHRAQPHRFAAVNGIAQGVEQL